MRIIGLMSGTSIDGVDACLVDIRKKGKDFSFKLLDFKTFPFPNGLKELVLAINENPRLYADTKKISQINFLIGELFAEASIKIAKNHGGIKKVDLIGSHGQTIFHNPKPEKIFGRKISSTFQIGEPSVIAYKTGVTTIADFRPIDVAAQGQGAPLCPIFHYYFLKKLRKNIIVNNIGGISNLTFIPKKGFLSDIIAFDTGPGNMIIDYLVKKLFPKYKYPYDKNGNLAKKGKVNERLLDKLMDHPFICEKPPKSSGREKFGKNFCKKILTFAKKTKINSYDLLRTVTEFTAISITHNYKNFILNRYPVSEVIFCGGGAKNSLILKIIKKELGNKIKVSCFDKYGISAHAVESICFAFLSYLTYLGKCGNVPNVTGAKKSLVLGKIIYGSKK